MDNNFDHMEYFNLAIGLVFKYLFTNFPIYQRIEPSYLGEDFLEITEMVEADRKTATGVKQLSGETYIKNSNIPPSMYVKESLHWLESEGFVSRKGSDEYPEYQLTSKSLAILGKTPSGVDESLGKKLVGTAKAAGGEARRAAIGEVVGQILGAAVRGAAGVS